MAIVLAVGLLVGTEAGSRWVLGKFPGLQVEAFSGRLGGRWQADGLVWEQDRRRVEVASPQMSWSPSCLLRKTLCIEELVTGDIDLRFPPADEEETASEPFKLPELDLPLELRIERVDIGAVNLNGVQQLQGAELQADWDEQGLAIRSLTVRRDDVVLELAGRLLTKADWPLALEGTAAIRSPNAQPWALKFEVDGELRERLVVDLQSQGYLDAKLSGWVPLSLASR